MSKSKKYAIVDIETTGSFAAKNRITEIAIIIHNGEDVLDEFQTLINPLQTIPSKIQYLTGITNEMVADAPIFSDVADEIYSYLKDCVFVAHNVNFDYSFIANQFQEVGINFSPNKLCTVRLSRKIFPGYHSYSLGNICSDLNISIHDRHRAYGDALATAKLFSLLYKNDTNNLIIDFAKKTSSTQRLPIHLDHKSYENLPQTTGIYFFKDKYNKIIYVGKAINIKKRVYQHFNGKNTSIKRQEFLKEIFYIDFYETGNELMALLYEYKFIKKHWPKYNRALKKYDPKFCLIEYQDQEKYMHLALVKHHKNIHSMKNFERIQDATECLLNLMKEYEINPLKCHFYNQEKFDEFEVEKLKLKFKSESIRSHNDKVYKALDTLIGESKTYYVLGNGRDCEEYSYIYIKNNNLYSFGFFQKNMEFNSIEDAINVKDLTESSYYILQLIENFKNSFNQKVIHL